MKSVIWNYSDNISRKKAEERIYKLGFKDDKIRGWIKPLGKTQIHIIPSDNYMIIHRDDENHMVMSGIKIREILLYMRDRFDNKNHSIIKYIFIVKLRKIKKYFKKLYKKYVRKKN